MIKNIIFDLGGVLLTLDMQKTVSAFQQLGWKEKDLKSITHNGYLTFENLEIGMDSPMNFRDNIRTALSAELSDEEIDTAWNAMLLDFPTDIIEYVLELKQQFRLFVLSNTNELHRIRFSSIFENKHGYPIDQLFEKTFYSHQLGLRKPDPEIYRRVLEEADLEPETTLFVDDLKINTDSAEKLGMKTLYIQAGTLLETLPEFLAKEMQKG